MKPARRAFDGGYATCSLQSLTTCSLQSLGGPPVPRRVKPAALRRCTYAGRSDATSFDRLPTLLLAELLRFVEDIAALSAALADVSRSHALPGLVHCELAVLEMLELSTRVAERLARGLEPSSTDGEDDESVVDDAARFLELSKQVRGCLRAKARLIVPFVPYRRCATVAQLRDELEDAHSRSSEQMRESQHAASMHVDVDSMDVDSR
ncbi:hypothetical protein M885DRAFT_615188 [Pelagophyceae sp. CCMP2097]|nr:hypothetical protein M885DRAFT_615188 [Pelagophyceae sp. CCMP2097]